jgi:hypothetical protein
MDGIDLIPVVEQSVSFEGNGYPLRKKEMGFWTANQQAVIDNGWKIVRAPGMGQCDGQPPYNTWKNISKDAIFLFNLDEGELRATVRYTFQPLPTTAC